MAHRNCFSGYHPLVNLIYFALVLLFSMCFLHPLALALSLLSALAYSGLLNGWKGAFRSLLIALPILLMATVLNPLFHSAGNTVLLRLPGGAPLTLESTLYGLASATMLVTVLLWFSCSTVIMTSDKFLYLFGRILPAMSLLLSMTLRFIPRFKAQFRTVSEAQRCVGRDVSQGTMVQRLRHTTTILSIMVAWSLENAIETADSMKSRGYGLPGRSAFSLYRFDRRDKLALAWLLGSGCLVAWGGLTGRMAWEFFPALEWAPMTPAAALCWLVYLLLALTPVLLELQNLWLWKKLMQQGGPARV